MASRDSRERAAQIAFWDAVNAYARACGGNTGTATTSDERMDAVVAVERAARAYANDLARDTAAQVRAAWCAGRDAAAEVCWGRVTGHGEWSVARGEATKCESAIRALTPPGEARGETEKSDGE